MWQDVPNNEILEELFQMFNLSRPQDFEGHSLSVSDVIALKRNGKVSVHYVDSIGFKELPGFLDKKPEHSSVPVSYTHLLRPAFPKLRRLKNMSEKQPKLKFEEDKERTATRSPPKKSKVEQSKPKKQKLKLDADKAAEKAQHLRFGKAEITPDEASLSLIHIFSKTRFSSHACGH